MPGFSKRLAGNGGCEKNVGTTLDGGQLSRRQMAFTLKEKGDAHLARGGDRRGPGVRKEGNDGKT